MADALSDHNNNNNHDAITSSASSSFPPSSGMNMITTISSNKNDNVTKEKKIIKAPTPTLEQKNIDTTMTSAAAAAAAPNNNNNDDDDKTQLASRKRKHFHHYPPRIRIVSATYGPSDGRRLLQGNMMTTTTSTTATNSEAGGMTTDATIERLPYTRDVTPFLRAMIPDYNSNSEEEEEYKNGYHGYDYNGYDNTIESCKRRRERRRNNSLDYDFSTPETTMEETTMTMTTGIKQRIAIPVMDGRSMNALFGDPCLGTTKCLRVTYYFDDGEDDDDDDNDDDDDDYGHGLNISNNEDNSNNNGGKKEEKSSSSSCSSSKCSRKRVKKKEREICKSIFAEHDQVILKRNIIYNPDDDDDDENDEPPAKTLSSSSLTTQTTKTSTSPSKKWRLRPATSEIVLPMILPFLKVLQRAQCQLVCHAWLTVVRDRGVATTVNVNDPSSFPIQPDPSEKDDDDDDDEEDTSRRAYLRGIVKHSYTSLTSLILNDLSSLQPSDLHPALPHLKKLQTLDVSRCIQLTNDTLILLSQQNSLCKTLRVLSLKGLRNTTDKGIIFICKSCIRLKVLDVSDLSITDESGVAIGRYLHFLVALYMRNNYLITDRSVNVMMRHCGKLKELVLWGCARLKHLNFGVGGDNDGGVDGDTGGVVNNHRNEGSANDDNNDNHTSTSVGGIGSFVRTSSAPSLSSTNQTTTLACDKIVLLNLWGCYSLSVDAVNSMASLRNLKSLILSECHRLKDDFVVNLAQTVPHIHHLHLRYVRRITDVSVNAITNNMHSLYTLDLSFCTKITPSALVHLLEIRAASLSELRLYSCSQLDIDGPPPGQQGRRRPRPAAGGGGATAAGGVGRLFLGAIRSQSEQSILSILDMRECGGVMSRVVDRKPDEVFERGMVALGFEQKIAGFFTRPARWSVGVQRRMMEHLAGRRREIENERRAFA